MSTSTQWSHPQRSNVSTIFLLPPTTQLCGQLRKGNIQTYTKIISSGFVGWGFPIRTEGICEYVVVNITPKK